MKARCNNCMAVFEEEKIIWDSAEDKEFCPECGEAGCLMDLNEDESGIGNLWDFAGELAITLARENIIKILGNKVLKEPLYASECGQELIYNALKEARDNPIYKN